MPINKLILGDCLEILKTLETERPGNRNYEVIWATAGTKA